MGRGPGDRPAGTIGGDRRGWDPRGASHPDKTRNDVVAATGHAGLAYAGFDAALRTTAGHRIEVYGERGDGTFVKLVGGARQ